jgi:hypothetical protein
MTPEQKLKLMQGNMKNTKMGEKALEVISDLLLVK